MNEINSEFNLYTATDEEVWRKLRETITTKKSEGTNIELEEKETLDKIKNGYRIKVPYVYLYREGYYEEYPSGKRVRILGYGKYPLKEFIEEKERRREECTRIIIKYTEEEPNTEIRT